LRTGLKTADKAETLVAAAVFWALFPFQMSSSLNTFICRAAFYASLVYLFVAVFVVGLHGRFGIAQFLLATIATIGAGSGLMAAKRRSEASAKPTETTNR
jgi:hypothetical protein